MDASGAVFSHSSTVLLKGEGSMLLVAHTLAPPRWRSEQEGHLPVAGGHTLLLAWASRDRLQRGGRQECVRGSIVQRCGEAFADDPPALRHCVVRSRGRMSGPEALCSAKPRAHARLQITINNWLRQSRLAVYGNSSSCIISCCRFCRYFVALAPALLLPLLVSVFVIPISTSNRAGNILLGGKGRHCSV